MTIYEGGREDDDEEEEESIYTNVKEMMEKRRVAHRPSVRFLVGTLQDNAKQLQAHLGFTSTPNASECSRGSRVCIF